MGWSRGELLEHPHVGGRSGLGLLEDPQVQLVEQDVGQLFGRLDVERTPGQLEDDARSLVHGLLQL